jgi:hypothetical protein
MHRLPADGVAIRNRVKAVPRPETTQLACYQVRRGAARQKPLARFRIAKVLLRLELPRSRQRLAQIRVRVCRTLGCIYALLNWGHGLDGDLFLGTSDGDRVGEFSLTLGTSDGDWVGGFALADEDFVVEILVLGSSTRIKKPFFWKASMARSTNATRQQGSTGGARGIDAFLGYSLAYCFGLVNWRGTGIPGGRVLCGYPTESPVGACFACPWVVCVL